MNKIWALAPSLHKLQVIRTYSTQNSLDAVVCNSHWTFIESEGARHKVVVLEMISKPTGSKPELWQRIDIDWHRKDLLCRYQESYEGQGYFTLSQRLIILCTKQAGQKHQGTKCAQPSSYEVDNPSDHSCRFEDFHSFHPASA